MAHSHCRWTCGCAGKTVKSLQNTCHTWALLGWWFTKRRYIKCTYLLHLPFCDVCSFIHIMPLWHIVIFDMYRNSLCWHWNMLVPSFLTKSAIFSKWTCVPECVYWTSLCITASIGSSFLATHRGNGYALWACHQMMMMIWQYIKRKCYFPSEPDGHLERSWAIFRLEPLCLAHDAVTRYLWTRNSAFEVATALTWCYLT